ncbi:MAG: Tim44 domain-containing protein [Gammaproteobacteria bacterium]|nr:Tim44 domain-containing protein [Gammaproteobacteria bacterium]
MKKSTGIVFTVMLGFVLTLGSLSDAEARRLGGGGSFGGKSLFSSPYKRATASPARTARQQQATQQNQAAKQTFAKRGGWMGMLGGLAIGGLLGSLLFGGAFENINFMDILIFGGIAFMLFKFLGARAATNPRPAYARNSAPPARERVGPATLPTSSFDTKAWFRGTQANAPANQSEAQEHDYALVTMPAGFDEQTFIAGARIAYRDLQKAWDAGDLATLQALATPTMFAEIQTRMKSQDANNRTDVLKLETELLDVREVEGMLEAVVLFDAILREDTHERAGQVREVWHFTKPVASQHPKWFLDGIQQLEDDA